MLLAKPFETIYEKPASGSNAEITVLISCYKYGREATEALASLLKQSEPRINVVLVDDHSPDDSVEILRHWFGNHGNEDKLASIKFVRHLENQGASQTRNTALSLIDSPYTFVLDADNQLYPRALKVLREALENSGYAMAYSLVEKFGDQPAIMNNSVWIPEKFSHGNYIDTLALIRTNILKELGGYRIMPKKFGWEDYDLWCSFVDRGLKGCHVPQILCRYHVHEGSITQTSAKSYTEQHIDKVREDFEAHHKMPFYLYSDRGRRNQTIRRALTPGGSAERVRVVRALCSRLPFSEKTKHSISSWILRHLQIFDGSRKLALEHQAVPIAGRSRR